MPKPCRIPPNIDTSAAAIRPRMQPPSKPASEPAAAAGLVLFPVAVNQERAAATLGISPRKLSDLRAAGDLHPFKVGSRTLYAVSELQRFAEQQTLKHRQSFQAGATVKSQTSNSQTAED